MESLAHVALIARYGADWFREAGRGETRGTMLVTVTPPGSGGTPRVHEVELGTTIGEIGPRGGGCRRRARGAGATAPPAPDIQAVLLGGYFGRGCPPRPRGTPPDPAALRPSGISVGAGVVAFLSTRRAP